MKHSIAGAVTGTVLLLSGITLLNLSEYHLGVLAAMTVCLWVWVFAEALRSAGERGPRHWQGLDAEHEVAAPRIVRGASVERIERVAALDCVRGGGALPALPAQRLRFAMGPDVRHEAQLERHRRRYLAALAAIAAGTYRNEDDDDIGEWEEEG